MFHHLSAEKRIEGNSAYPQDMIAPEHHRIPDMKPLSTVTKIGEI